MATARPQGPAEQRRQRLIRIALLVILGLSAVVIVGPLALPWVDWPWNMTVTAIMLGVATLYGFAYWRNERGAVEQAAYLLVVGILLGSFLPILVPGAISGPRSYAFILSNVLVAAFALSWRHGAVVALLDATLLLTLRYIQPGYAPQFIEDVLLLTVLSSLILAFAAYGDRNRQVSLYAQSEMARTVADLQALLDNGPDAMLTVRRDGTVSRLNHVARRWALRHLGKQLAPGDRLDQVLGAEHWARLEPLLADAEDSTGVSSEMSYQSDSGPVWLQVHLRLIQDADAFAVQIRDVSASRRVEMRERAAYRDRMELEKLRDIDRFRTQLLNTASHEMRTPMTPLRLQLGVLEHRLEGVLDEKARQSFTTIKRNVARLTMLLDDLLDVARLEAGELRLQPEEFDLDSFLTGEVEAYRAIAETKGVTLSMETDIQGSLRGDPRRLAQVMSNLLSNALKYTRSSIDVIGRRDGDDAIIEIKDDGAGFAPEEGRRLWEPFVQVQRPERQREGTGLGLFISKGIIDHHRGRIWAESEGPDKGATFGFSLPLKRATLKYEGGAMTTHE